MTKVSTPPEVEIRARELLACPFCGADDNSGVAPSHDDEDYDGPIFWSVGCGCTAFVGPWSTEEEAIKCWNTRPALTPQDDVVEKGWQPIETLREEDGIILAFAEYPAPRGSQMIWDATSLLRSLSMAGPRGRHMVFNATHWMPLPEPPCLEAIRVGGGM